MNEQKNEISVIGPVLLIWIIVLSVWMAVWFGILRMEDSTLAEAKAVTNTLQEQSARLDSLTDEVLKLKEIALEKKAKNSVNSSSSLNKDETIDDAK